MTAWHGWGRPSVQTWENIGVELGWRQPPGRPGWEALRFSACPLPSLSRKLARAEPAIHPQVGADQECGSWPKGPGCPLSSNHAHPAPECITWRRGGVLPKAKPGEEGWCRVGVVPLQPRWTHPQWRGAASIQPCPGSRPLGLASQSPPLGTPGPTGRMGTEASFLPTLCL